VQRPGDFPSRELRIRRLRLGQRFFSKIENDRVEPGIVLSNALCHGSHEFLRTETFIPNSLCCLAGT
jgi:hypothetical protein